MGSLADALSGTMADDLLMAACTARISVGLRRPIRRFAADRSVIMGTHLRSRVDAAGQLGSIRRIFRNVGARTAEDADDCGDHEKQDYGSGKAREKRASMH